MASFRSALALISICILVSLSGFADCRFSSQRDQLARENKQNDHLPPLEKEEFHEIVRKTQAFSLPFERSDLRENDGIFLGERRRGFRFGRPVGCHHGKFNRRGQRKSEHMHFPDEFQDLRAGSGDFHPRMDRPLPEKRGFDPEGEWRRPEGRGNEHMPFPGRKGLLDSFLEIFLRPFPGHEGPGERDFHPRMDRPFPEERHFNPDFPRREWRHPGGENRGEGNEHMPFPPTAGWLEFFFHPFFRHHDSAEIHRRESELKPLPRKPEFGHGFPRVDEFHPKVDEFKREFGHHFSRVDEFKPRDEFSPEFGHPIFRHGDTLEFHRREGELKPLPRNPGFGHGFARVHEFHPKVDEFRREFSHDFPGVHDQMPFPEEQEESFPHPFPENKEVHSRIEEFMPLPRVRDFHHGFPGREGRHGEEEKEKEHLPYSKESFTDTLPVQGDSTEYLRLPRGGDLEQSIGGGERGKKVKID